MNTTIILSAVSSLATFFTLVVSIITYRQSKVYDRRKATLDAFNRLQEQVLDKLNKMPPSYIRSVLEDKRCDEYKLLGEYLARVEHFCTGITQGIYDFGTFYALSHGYFDDKVLLSRLLPIIEKRNNDPSYDYYQGFHKVLVKMNRRSSLKKPKSKQKIEYIPFQL